jgi:hypothetical protein
MAALAIASVFAATSENARAEDGPVVNKVYLQLQIAGLGPNGCSVEIKPGHPGCQFDKVEKQIKSEGQVVTVDPIAINAKSTGADHDCSFAITIKEPGRRAKTFRRGVCLTAPVAGKPAPAQTLKCFLSAEAVASKDTGARKK